MRGVDDSYQSNAYEPGDIYTLLLNASALVVEKGPVIRDGMAMAGAGGVTWRAFSVKEALMTPPRPAIRWFPQDGRQVPPGFSPANASKQ
jgi:hypothetical protein